MVVNFKVFKKCSPNNMITLYMNRREFVDSVTQVEPIGRYPKGMDRIVFKFVVNCSPNYSINYSKWR